jgi:membrane protein YqaA with SNARE-associated domain
MFIKPPGDKTFMQSWKEGLVQIVCVILIVAAVLFLGGRIREFSSFGYIGVFVISLLSSATILLPVPGWMAVISMSRILNPYIVGIVAGLGSGLGEFTGYAAGDGVAKLVVKDEKKLEEYKRLIEKYEVPGIFVLAFIPNPFFDVAGIAAGSVEVPLWKFLAACIAGRVLRYILLAYIGAFSLNFI